jgi:NTP pyrophosphatase (non-canonical NTP hydrolase)
MTDGIAMLSDLTLDAVRAESIRAHVKHHRPDEGSGSLFDDGLTILSRLAALMEEVGEVADELVKAGSDLDTKLLLFSSYVFNAGEVARKMTYDGGGEPGLTGTGMRELPPRVDRAKLRKELIQVANVALSWAQQVEDGGHRS